MNWEYFVLVQIAVGILQPIAGLVRLALAKSNEYIDNLKNYFGLVLTYIFILTMMGSIWEMTSIPEPLVAIYLFGVPWCIAAYYCYVVYKVYYDHEKPTEEDEYVPPIIK